MEDEHICIDNLLEHVSALDFPSPGALYGVFDGHCGLDATTFVRENILKFIVEDAHFPNCVENAIRSAFVKDAHAFSDNCSLDSSSGTTFDCSIFWKEDVNCQCWGLPSCVGERDKAVELSKDHKPDCNSERLRIVELGGYVLDGYLNGQLSVTRALGDCHMKGLKGTAYPLNAEPELQETILTEDEFLIMGCDGLWDVIFSQCAVTIVRRELIHNDPERCAVELDNEALKWKACDNLTVIVDHLGEVVFVELPETGGAVTKASGFVAVESVKATSDINSPISGEIVEVNTKLTDTPGLISSSPYEDGWMIKVKPSSPAELESLMDSKGYTKFCEEEDAIH